jgi:hypothetical protein
MLYTKPGYMYTAGNHSEEKNCKFTCYGVLGKNNRRIGLKSSPPFQNKLRPPTYLSLPCETERLPFLYQCHCKCTRWCKNEMCCGVIFHPCHAHPTHLVGPVTMATSPSAGPPTWSMKPRWDIRSFYRERKGALKEWAGNGIVEISHTWKNTSYVV